MTQGIAAEQLHSIVTRIETLEERKADIAGDIRDVYTEAKLNGFDAKIMRKIVSIRRMDREKRIEEETILDLYMQALGEI